MNTYIEERVRNITEYGIRPGADAERDWKTHVATQAAVFYADPYLPAQKSYDFIGVTSG